MLPTNNGLTVDVPLRIYAPAWQSNGASSRYPTHAASMNSLHFLMDSLHISSKYQLGMLLGLGAANVRNVYGYFTGQRQPAAIFLNRGFHLLDLYHQGVPLNRASYIDWPHGFIAWKNGKVSYADPKTGEWGGIPTPETAQTPKKVAYV